MPDIPDSPIHHHTYVEGIIENKCAACGQDKKYHVSWLTLAADNAMRRQKLTDALEGAMSLEETQAWSSTVLSEDDKAELLMYAVGVSQPPTVEEATHLYVAIDRIIRDKMKEVLHLIDKQKQTRPMNGDGHNYSLGLAEKAIKREFHLEESV